MAGGATPLTPNVGTARSWRSGQIIKLLVEDGADVNARDEMGHTPLWYAAWTTQANNKRTIATCITNYKTPPSATSTPYTKMPTNNWSSNTSSSNDSGVTGAAKFVTSTLGNTVGGVSKTVGGVTGAATRGLGDTVNSATGSTGRPVGDALGSVGTGLEDGLKKVGKGVEDAGQWK
ncbi:hypothetical protein BDW68DRAFT_175045 [Aspergillus falconensis]